MSFSFVNNKFIEKKAKIVPKRVIQTAYLSVKQTYLKAGSNLKESADKIYPFGGT